MNDQLRSSLGNVRGTVATRSFNVTIICETPEVGKGAERFSDQLFAEAAPDRTFKLSLWNFGILGIPEVRNAAASTAAEADMVILSLGGTIALPAQALAWIEMWTWLVDRHRPVMVALFGAQHREGAGIRAYLRGKAGSKKLDFFPVLPHTGATRAKISVRFHRTWSRALA